MPVVSLDVDSISDELAARLAISLLGHVLFLKSQSTARALKQRTELLSSFDTLSSHLNTTFTALSSALARVRNPHEATSNPTTGRAYLAIFVGSQTASAKSKVIYAVDGLELKKIGARDDKTIENENHRPMSDSGEENEDETFDGSDEQDVEDDSGEDDVSGEELPMVLDATQLSNHVTVCIKRIDPKEITDEVKIATFLSTMVRDPRNHCVEIIESFRDPILSKVEYMVMPSLRSFNDPEFGAVGEVVDFVTQMLEVHLSSAPVFFTDSK
ncbi:hypothetical protein DXG03_003568 [Asterophora parasitica]|uniref:Uncharacterized protein n=1 Tax=Asterophora parasitica TaxID=117018 RepID=A0A9P7G4V6_9AGAR|nr:hypothetical protein DXG03_003568 [Asterophora parasitica]